MPKAKQFGPPNARPQPKPLSSLCEVCDDLHKIQQGARSVQFATTEKEKYPLIWGTYSSTGTNVSNLKPAWYHCTNATYPYKDRYLFCKRKAHGTDLKSIDQQLAEFMPPPSASEKSKNPPDEGIWEFKKPGCLRCGSWLDHAVDCPLRPKSVGSGSKYTPPTLTEDRARFHIKSIAGRLLTIMDAMFGANPIQCEAMKTIVKKEFRTQLSRISTEILDRDTDSASEETPEDRAAKELRI